jgi:hypothetical protein
MRAAREATPPCKDRRPWPVSDLLSLKYKAVSVGSETAEVVVCRRLLASEVEF